MSLLRFTGALVAIAGVVLILALLLGAYSEVDPSGPDDPQSWRTVRVHPLVSPPAPANFQSICCGEDKPVFAPEPIDALSLPYGPAPQWLQIDTQGRGGILVFSAIVDVAELYLYDRAKGSLRVSRSGDTVPASEREIVASRIAFPISSDEANAETYLNVVQETRTTVRFELYDPPSFDAMIHRMDVIRSLLLGAVLMIALYNIALFYLLDDPTFVFNAMTTLSLALLDVYLSGVGAAYLWGEYPWLSNLILVASIGCTIIFSHALFYSFLRESPKSGIWQDRIFLIVPALTMCALLALAVLPYWVVQIAMLVFSAATFFFLIAVTASAAWLGDPRARMILIPLALVLLPGISLVAGNRLLGWQFAGLDEHILEVILVLEALLFSFALAYKVRLAEEERARANLAMTELGERTNRELLQAIDQERTRIAADLHDSAGQGLVLAASRLSHLGQQPGLKAAVRSELREIADVSKSIIGDIRRISHNLHSATLDHLGLDGAVRSLVQQVRNGGELEIEYRGGSQGLALSKDQEMQVYRIVQELLTNVLKHARAGRCEVHLACEGEGALLQVTDDGSGFPLAQRAGVGGNGLGLRIVEQRVKTLSGKMQAASDESGTSIAIWFPLESNRGDNRREP